MNQLLVLGATSDIAQAIAHQFASRGFAVVLAARNVARLNGIKSDLHIRHKVNVKSVEFNAGDFDAHQSLLADIRDSNVVVCAFGYLGDQTTASKSWKESHDIITSNYTGAVSILNITGEAFREMGSGTIIGISSVAGERGRGSNYIYGSAKAGFTAYLSGLRNYLTPSGVHVITVLPGFVKTKMTEGLPLPKPLTAVPDNVAKEVYNAYQKKKNTIYTLWMWRWIMLIIKLIPESIFKKMKL